MIKTWRIGQVLGFPLLVDVTFLVLAAIFVFQDFGRSWDANVAALLRLPILFGAIVIHELGHALAIQKFGHGRSRIVLWGMGGVCQGGGNYRPTQGLWVALAGPLAGALPGLLALAGALFLPHLPVVTASLWFTVQVTLGWSLLNLLPIFPLDGGRAVMYGLQAGPRWSPDRSARAAGLLGLVLLVPLALLALWDRQLWTVFVLYFIGQTTWRAWRFGARGLAA